VGALVVEQDMLALGTYYRSNAQLEVFNGFDLLLFVHFVMNPS